MEKGPEGVEENGLGEEAETGLGEKGGEAAVASRGSEGEVMVGIGKRIGQVQELWGNRFGISQEELKGAFDKLWEDDETFAVGELTCNVVHLPGQ